MESKSIVPQKDFRQELIEKNNMKVRITKLGPFHGEVCDVVDHKGRKVYKLATSDGDRLFDRKDFEIMPTPAEIEAQKAKEAQKKAYEAEVRRIIEGPYDHKTMNSFEIHLSVSAAYTREKLLQLGERMSQDIARHGERLKKDSLYGANSSGFIQGDGANFDRLCGEYSTIIDDTKNYVAMKINMPVNGIL